MSLELEVPGIEVRNIGKCANCGKEAIYYDTKKEQYVCSEHCYSVLNNKVVIALNKFSKIVDETLEDREENAAITRDAIKILADALTLAPREAIKYFKEKK